MLNDPRAIEIISRARQKNVAAPERPAFDFDHIFADFFAQHEFNDELVMDLGPGQYDFAVRVRERGGTVHNIDNDPAVLELGRYLGFEVFDENLNRFAVDGYRGRYDGLFCKFAVNAFWFDDLVDLESHVRVLDSMIKPSGWGWVGPWNGAGKRPFTAEQLQTFLTAQAECFMQCGWSAYRLDKVQATYYGLHGAVTDYVLFVKNLPAPTNIVKWSRESTAKQRFSRILSR